MGKILRTIIFIFLQLGLLRAGVAYADDHAPHAGMYIPMGFGAQYSPVSWGGDLNIGFGIRIFHVGIAGEAHYVYNWVGSVPGVYSGVTRQSLYLGRFDIYPVGHLKLSFVGGGTFYSPDSGGYIGQALGGGRIAYEGHTGHLFAMEPYFMMLTSVGPLQYQTYNFGIAFSIWNEAALGSILSGLVSGLVSRH